MKLSQIAHTRSGDKGDTANIGVIAWREEDYVILQRELTAERVKAYFGDLVQGEVERFELPNLGRAQLSAARKPGRWRHCHTARGCTGQDLWCGAAEPGNRCLKFPPKTAYAGFT